MRISNPTDLGLLIRQSRKQAGLTQASLAERARISTRWVIEMERGKDTAELGLVFRVLAALGLAVDIASPSARRKSGKPTDNEAGGGQASRSKPGGPAANSASSPLLDGPSMAEVLDRHRRGE